MKEYKLKAAQNGFAAGKVLLIEAAAADDNAEEHADGKDAGTVAGSKMDSAVSGSVDSAVRSAADLNVETSLFDAAVSQLEQELSDSAAKAGNENAGIFEAEKLLLTDDRFIESAKGMIRDEKLDAASAAVKAGKMLADEMSKSDSDYIRHRSDDLTGIAGRLAGIIKKRKNAEDKAGSNESNVEAAATGADPDRLEEPVILASEELSPAQISAFDASMLIGLLTAKGAPTSHVSIMAGNLGIPYCYGSVEALGAVSTGDRIIIDGDKLTIDPDEDTYQAAVQKMETLIEKRKQELEKARAEAAKATKTRIYANISGPQDIEELLKSGAEGVGLFRTELLFLADKAEPTEEEQFQAYKAVAEAMAGKETVIRTMDLGSDKKADWLKLPDENNPALGCRGVRVSLKDKELFKKQLRALLRAASCGNVKVMVPMIASYWEVDAVREIMDKCAKELSDEGVEYKMPSLGIMVETPAAVMCADELAEKVDFFSIGTNDLTQYTLALDREAVGLDEYYDPCHPAVLRLIGMTAAAGHRHNTTTAVCGELASNPKAVDELIRRGVDELSVSAGKVEKTKALVVEAEKKLAEDGTTIGADEAAADNGAAAIDTAAADKMVCSLAAVADGKLIPMEDIPDPAFAGGTLGDCVGIMPDNGKIYAPCDGTISGVAETKHAVTITSTDGRAILIHAGIDTVKLNGKGFTVHVKAGDAVTTGELIMEADLDIIRDAGLSAMIITAITE